MNNDSIGELFAQRPSSPLFARVASEHLAAGRTAEARDELLKGLLVHPRYAVAHLLLARCHAAEQHFPEAIISLTTAQEILPGAPPLVLLRDQWERRISGVSPDLLEIGSYEILPPDQPPTDIPAAEATETAGPEPEADTGFSPVAPPESMVTPEPGRSDFMEEAPVTADDEPASVPTLDGAFQYLDVSESDDEGVDRLIGDLIANLDSHSDQPAEMLPPPEQSINEQTSEPETEAAPAEPSGQMTPGTSAAISTGEEAAPASAPEKPQPDLETSIAAEEDRLMDAAEGDEAVMEVPAEQEAPAAQEEPGAQEPPSVSPGSDESAVEAETSTAEDAAPADISHAGDEYRETGNLTAVEIPDPVVSAENRIGRIVSKTLAEIYASQGEYEEAILTYQMLKRSKPDQRGAIDQRIGELALKLREKLEEK